MTEQGRQYLNALIEELFTSNSSNQTNVRLIRHNNILSITEAEFQSLEFRDGVESYFHTYNHEDMMEAYEPFLNVIRDIVKKHEIDVDSLFEKAEVYCLHREIFKSYFEQGICERFENAILSELEYEHGRFMKGILYLLRELSKICPIVILLNKVNQITSSSLSLLSSILEWEPSNLKIIGIVDQLRSISLYVTEQYNEFIAVCEEKSCINDWINDSAMGTSSEGMEEDHVFTLHMQNYKTYFRRIRNMLVTFAFEQAWNYLNFMNQRIELDRIPVSSSVRKEVYVLFIEACVYRRNYSMALAQCDNLKQLKLDTAAEENEKMFLYCYYVAIANMTNGSFEEAGKYITRCRKYAETEFQMFKAELMKNMIECRGWDNICIVGNDISVNPKLQDWCIKYGYKNHLAHIYVYCYDNHKDLFYSPDGIEERIPITMKGIRLAEELGNSCFLIEAYRKNVMLSSYNGYNHTSNYFYSKIIPIAKKEHDKMTEAHVYNGEGYNSSSMDNYVAANDYYNKALEIYYEEKSMDYIMETLYNMGMNAILSCDFYQALACLEAVTNIMRILKKNVLRVANISKIYGLLAIAAYRVKKYHTTLFYLNKSKQVLEHVLDSKQEDFESHLWDDDLFLYYYMIAVMRQYEGDYEAALENYDKSEFYMERSQGSLYFNFSQFVQDKSELLHILDREDDRKRLLNIAKEYYMERGSFYCLRMVEELLYNGERANIVMEMPIRTVQIKDIIKLAKRERTETEALEKRTDLQFFSSFQELISHTYEDVESQTETLLLNYKNNFFLEHVIYISCENDKYSLCYSSLPYALQPEELAELVAFFKKCTDGFVVSKFSNNYVEYTPVLKFFRRSQISSFVAVPLFRNEELSSIFISFDRMQGSWNNTVKRKTLDDTDLEMHRLVFRQIVDANEKYKLNEKLKEQAITDELTGLFNRKGYYNKLDDLIERGKQDGACVNVTMIYADLDHFKYYNDTFGHHVGDALLVEFSKIFKRACGKYGSAIRFGGDEFVMLLETTDRETIHAIVENIYTSMEIKKGFKETVARYMDGEFEIPKEHMVNCSMGIASMDNIKRYEEYSELRKEADGALYEVKNNGRGYSVWA